MATRILQGPVVKDRADRTDSTVAGDQLRGAGDIQELPEGVIRLSDPSVGATAGGGPAAVAWPIAHRGRVTWIDVRGKVDKDRLLWAAVAAVTRGQRFLEQATIGGRVLWVSQEAAADLKAQLAEVDADLDKVFFIRGPRPDTDDESSLPRIVALLRPVWVIIDPWPHYLQVQRVTAAAGPGAEKLLLGDIVDWAREYEVAVTVSHDNEKNRPGAYTDSAVLGATDMVVSLGPGKSPTTLRLQPSGRWQDPVDIRRTLGCGYSVVKGTEQAGRSRTDARWIDDRVVLHLYELSADTRLSARSLAASLACQGRRYDELSSALDRLLAEGIVDRAQRSGASSGRGRGYALTERGSRRAECLRQGSDSGASTNREASAACSAFASVSGAAFPAVGRSGNATTPARETSAEGCSETVSEAAFPAVGRSGNATTPAGEASAACSAFASVSGAAFPAVGRSGNATTSAGEASAACSAFASVSEAACAAVGGNENATMSAGDASAQGCSEIASEAASPAVGGNGNETTPGGEVSAACSEGASVSGGAGHVGDEVVGDGRAEPASRRSCTRQLEDQLVRLFRPHGASETRLMFTTVLTLFRHSGQSVEGVSPAFKRLVADGYLHKVPSQYYPQCRYALTERGRQLVAFPPKGANWGPASTHKE